MNSVHENPALVLGIDRAITFHDNLRINISRLDAGFASMALTPRLSAPWRHFHDGIADHMRVEEEILFPALRAIATGQTPADVDFETPLHELSNELDELSTILDALRNAAPEAGALEQDLLTMLDELEEHARKEETVLEPAASAMVRAWRGLEPAETEPAHAAHHMHHAQPTHPPPHMAMGAGPGSDGVLFRVFRRVLRAGLERLVGD